MKKGKVKKANSFETPYTIKNAITKGDWATHISLLVMGFGNLVHKQIVKGLIFLCSEIAFIVFMITTGISQIGGLITLGSVKQGEVFDESLGIYVYTQGDQSQLMLLYGIAVVMICILFIFLWRASVKSSYMVQCIAHEKKHINSIVDDVRELFDNSIHKLLMTPPLIGIIAFTVLPLLYMISMAFTSFSKENDSLILFKWVGFKNFKRVLDFSGTLGKSFWSVLAWTIVWALTATFSCYIFGIILALIINRKGTRFKKFWRSIFTLSIAIPQFVSLLAVRSMLKPQGVVNVMLEKWGLIDKALPFMESTNWARITVIIVNLWIGIPWTMIQLTGILQNIPEDQYEAARVDGAGPVRTFFSITMPYVFFVTAPYLITTFTGNVNNFNVIYLLTAGEPLKVGATSGDTDLLITWLYKLTVDKQYYNIGAVIGIFTFLVLAIVAFVTYSRSKALNNEEAYR